LVGQRPLRCLSRAALRSLLASFDEWEWFFPALAVDEDHVFVALSDAIARIDKASGTSTRVAEHLDEPAIALAVDGDAVYWTTLWHGTPRRVGKGGGGVARLARDALSRSYHHRIVVADGRVYWSWSNHDGVAPTGGLQVCDVDGSHRRALVGPGTDVHGIWVDGETIAFVDAENRVLLSSSDGGATRVLAQLGDGAFLRGGNGQALVVTEDGHGLGFDMRLSSVERATGAITVLAEEVGAVGVAPDGSVAYYQKGGIFMLDPKPQGP
jgi:hypothetical protein